MAAAIWQDQLLAGYRLLTAVTVTGLLVATAAAVVVAVAGGGVVSRAGAVGAVGLAGLVSAVVRRMREVTAHRSQDVDWWQRRVLDCEAGMGLRPLTEFKLAQHARKGLGPDAVAQTGPAAGPIPGAVMAKGPRHVRGAVDKAVFRSVQVAAWALACLGVVGALW